MVGGRQAELAIEQCDALGFDGEIWPVHPTKKLIGGRPVFRSVHELPSPPDAAFVAVNRLDTVEVVQALAKIGAGGAVCYAAGFAESGPEGAQLQQRLVTHDMAVIGPNCYGVINTVNGAALWPDVQGCSRTTRGAAVVTQSGNIALNLTMNRRGLEFTHVISLGNQAGVRIEDCIAHLAADPATVAIGVHAESIIDPVAFGHAAIAAHGHKTPIVMLKTGRSATASAIATSHTAAIIKPFEVYQALFDRYGVITVDSISELAATLDFLVRAGPLDSDRMTSLSCSGGEASLVADRAEPNGVAFAPFEPEQAERISAVLGPHVAITNPLDYHTFIWDHEPELTAAFTAALDGPANSAMLVLDWPAIGSNDASWWPTVRAIAAAHKTTGIPTIVTASIADNMPDRVRDELHSYGIIAGYSIDETMAAIGAAATAGAWLAKSPQLIHLAAQPAAPATVELDEPSAKMLLSAAGLLVPVGVVVEQGGELPEVLFPSVVKAVGMTHKSEHGGVVVGITDRKALVDAVAAMRQITESVYVEEQVTDVIAELLVTVRREPPIGTVLVLGAGGTLTEIIESTATALLPLEPEAIHRMIDSLPIGRILRGTRGRQPADLAALIDAVQALSKLMADRPDIVEIEINPLLATTSSVVVADALVTLEASP